MINPSEINLKNLPFVLSKKGFCMPISSLPEIPAVYFCLNSEGEPIYIGKANNLQTRWRNHAIKGFSEFEKLAWQACSINDVLHLEAKCIQHFKPKKNTKLRRIPSMLYGESKTNKSFVLRQEVSDRLDSLAERAGISRSEFIERSIRWLDEHWDGQLQREIGEGGNND